MTEIVHQAPIAVSPTSADAVLVRLGLALILERTPADVVLAETTCGERQIRLLGPSPAVRGAIANIEISDSSDRRVVHLVLNQALELVTVDGDGQRVGDGQLVVALDQEHPCDDCPGTMNLPVLGKSKFCIYLTASCNSGGGVTCCNGEIGGCVSSFVISQIKFSVCWS